jgi:hypothetical protein
MKAALLALGENAFLSGRSAAGLWELRPLSAFEIEVTVVANRTPRHPPLHIRRVTDPPHPDEVTTLGGLRVSSVSRTLLELAAREDETQLRQLVTAAARREILDIPDILRMIARHRTACGKKTLRRALTGYIPDGSLKSGFEDDFHAWLAEHPEIPPPLRDIHLGPWEIDCYWPHRQLAIELDGRSYHAALEDFERDRRKDAWLQRRGIRILRITKKRFNNDRASVLDDVRAFVRQRRAAWREAA